MRAAFWTLAACCGLVVTAMAAGPASTPAVGEADRLAAESLLNSAVSLTIAPADTPARAARLVALTRMAERLNPADPRVTLLKATIAEIQDRPAAAAEAMETYLASEKNDHAAGVRLLALRLASLNDADSRLAMLRELQEDVSQPVPLRAEAAVQQAKILDGQGDIQAVEQAFAEALQLDPHHPAALRGRLALREDPSSAERVTTFVRLLQGNPLAVSTAWEMALLLDSLGLHGEAVEMFDYAWAVFVQRNDAAAASEAFLVQYLDAMLDAGQARAAVEKFQPLADSLAASGEFQTLLIEAMVLAGQTEAADELTAKTAEQYKIARVTGQASAANLAAEAWFFLIVQPQPAEALKLAEQALAAEDSPVIQRVLGTAEVAAGIAEQGISRLESLVGSDPYAAAVLIDYYLGKGDETAARRIIEQILADKAFPRGGAAWRRIRTATEKFGVELPAVSDAEEIRQAAAEWSDSWRQMGVQPEAGLSVTLSAPDAGFRPGEPVEIAATLTNAGPLPVPLGEWGLMSPTLAVSVELDSHEGAFTDLPLVTWPAPRYLQPGQSVAAHVRLDAGRLARELAIRPLSNLKLTVTGLADPQQRDGKMVSALPSLKVEPLEIPRVGLLGGAAPDSPEQWASEYQLVLGRLVRDMRRGDLPTRLAAARNLGSLLAMLDHRDEGTVPSELAGVAGRPVLLSMLRAMLAGKSPAVRAEAIASLQRVRLTSLVLRLLGDVIEDPSPLVRFRLAELFGATATEGKETILAVFAADSDGLVRLMAEAFAKPEPASDAPATQPVEP